MILFNNCKCKSDRKSISYTSSKIIPKFTAQCQFLFLYSKKYNSDDFLYPIGAFSL